jgi:hypothetical protein
MHAFDHAGLLELVDGGDQRGGLDAQRLRQFALRQGLAGRRGNRDRAPAGKRRAAGAQVAVERKPPRAGGGVQGLGKALFG